jgi:hypothetical protein
MKHKKSCARCCNKIEAAEELSTIDTVKTGDLVFMSNNTVTGVVLKTFTSSNFNHNAIAIRLKEENGRYMIVPEGGSLCFLEVNSGQRPDLISASCVDGVALTEEKYILNKYNRIAIRRLKEENRDKLCLASMRYIHEFSGLPFDSNSLTFIGAWLGLPLKTSVYHVYCSEMVVLYYCFCLGVEADELFNGGPSLPQLFTPQTLEVLESGFLENNLEDVYTYSASVGSTLTPVLIVTVFLMIILAMGLRTV